jgi:hypothetical protein
MKRKRRKKRMKKRKKKALTKTKRRRFLFQKRKIKRKGTNLMTMLKMMMTQSSILSTENHQRLVPTSPERVKSRA